jgi:FixJ family two-component response regulator
MMYLLVAAVAPRNHRAASGHSLRARSRSLTFYALLKEDVVREMRAPLERGEGIKRIARELGVDCNTVKAWRARGDGGRPP